MMNVFKYEMKSYTKSILIWCGSIVALIVMFYMIYPTFGQDQAIMDKILEHYPEEMLKAFGMSTALPLSSVLGYTVFLFAFIQLLFAMQAGNYGFAILSVEERELTADYLMTKPVSRASILFSKFIAAWIALLITAAMSGIGLVVSIELFRDGNPYELKPLLVLMTSIVFFQLFYLSFGMVVSVMVRKIRNVLTFSLGLAFGTYILNAIRAIVGGEMLGYFSPFYHFDPSYILQNSQYDIPMAMISFAVIGLSLLATYVLYLKRDIYSL